MRIISGKLGGRVLRLPGNLPVRPTTDRTKESLFNIIGNHFDFEGLSVLELCAGTGNIGIEFWSRGATRILAIDKDKRCVAAVKHLYQSLNINEARIQQADIVKFVSQNTEHQQFDIVFLDPPYAMPLQDALIETILTQGWCKESGWIILEHSSLLDFSHVSAFQFCRKYGSSSISFFGKSFDA